MRLMIGVFLLVAGGCCAAPSHALRDLDDHRQLWKESGVENYRYVLIHTLTEFQEYASAIQVTVVDSRFKSAVYSQPTIGSRSDDRFVRHNEPVPPRVQEGIVKTIPDMFQIARSELCEGVYKINMDFDPEYGFIRRLFVNREEFTADEEYGYKVTDFEVLP